MTYPDTSLPGARDSLYGGRPASEFGQPAFKFIHSVLDFFERWFLDHTYQPRNTIVATAANAMTLGDVAVFVSGAAQPGGLYDARSYVAGLSSPRCLGVVVVAAAAGQKAVIATHGIIDASVSGLGGATGDVGMDATTGRLRPAQVGDVLVGQSDLNGNVFLDCYGVSLP